MTKKSALKQLQRGIILFWSLWFLIVFLTNLFDLLVTLQILDFNWPAVSNNYLLIEKTTSVYRFPHWLNDLLFFGVLAWEAICFILFLRAYLRFGAEEDRDNSSIYEAFGFGLALFCVFILVCEVFISYELEAVHLRVFMALLLSLLFIRQ